MSVVPRSDLHSVETPRRCSSAPLLTVLLLLLAGIAGAKYTNRHLTPGTPANEQPSRAAATRPPIKRLIRSVRSFSSLQVVKSEEKRFNRDIAAAAARHRIDPALLRAVIQVESNFAPRAKSPRGARGLMQLMPATARELGVRRTRRLYDPGENIRAGAAYLSVLATRFGETNADWIIAAYNAGPGAVSRWGGVPPYPETQEYVRRVAARWGRVIKDGPADAIVSG